VIERCAWSEARPALGETITPGAHGIDLEVQRNQAQPWRIDGGRAYMLTRLEATDAGPELVIIAARGVGVDRVMRQLQETARQQGIQSMRLHTRHGRAFARLIGRYGFREAERVYRVEL